MRWLPHEVTVEPAGEPVTLDELKAWTNIEAATADHDVVLALQLAAARRHIEDRTGTKLVSQTVKLRCDSFCAFRQLPVAPLQSIIAVKYLDPDGVEQTLAATVYEAVLIGRNPFIRLKPAQIWPPVYGAMAWPPVPGTPLYGAPDAIRVDAVAGYGVATAVPANLKAAIALLAADWFARREDTTLEGSPNSMPNGVKALLADRRTFF